MYLKVINGDGTCQTDFKTNTYSEYAMQSRLGCWNCSDSSVDYIIHSTTQIEDLPFIDL